MSKPKDPNIGNEIGKMTLNRLVYNFLQKRNNRRLTLPTLCQVKSESVCQQNVDMFANVDKEMATIIANNIGVEPPTISIV